MSSVIRGEQLCSFNDSQLCAHDDCQRTDPHTNDTIEKTNKQTTQSFEHTPRNINIDGAFKRLLFETEFDRTRSQTTQTCKAALATDQHATSTKVACIPRAIVNDDSW
jgi:hypothetical protein